MAAETSNKVVGAYDAKTHLPQLLGRVALGEEITITKHGTPIAKLVPVKQPATADQRRAAIARIRKLSRRLSLGGLSIRDLINEGRR